MYRILEVWYYQYEAGCFPLCYHHYTSGFSICDYRNNITR